MSDNYAQKTKKNHSRPKVSQLGLVPSIQKKSYNKRDAKTNPKNSQKEIMEDNSTASQKNLW